MKHFRKKVTLKVEALYVQKVPGLVRTLPHPQIDVDASTSIVSVYYQHIKITQCNSALTIGGKRNNNNKNKKTRQIYVFMLQHGRVQIEILASYSREVMGFVTKTQKHATTLGSQKVPASNS